jgi:hypothetical protein
MREELSPDETQRLAEAQLYYDRIDHSLHMKTVSEQHLGFLLTLVAKSRATIQRQRATIQRQRETINQLRRSSTHPDIAELDEEVTCRWLSIYLGDPTYRDYVGGEFVTCEWPDVGISWQRAHGGCIGPHGSKLATRRDVVAAVTERK